MTTLNWSSHKQEWIVPLCEPYRVMMGSGSQQHNVFDTDLCWIWWQFEFRTYSAWWWHYSWLYGESLMCHSWFEPINARCGLRKPTSRLTESQWIKFHVLAARIQAIWDPWHALPHFIVAVQPKLMQLKLECGTWYHHPRRLQCVLSRNLRIFKVATWHYWCRHNLKNNCIWDNLQYCLLVPRSPSKPVMLTIDLQSRKVLFIEIVFWHV